MTNQLLRHYWTEKLDDMNKKSNEKQFKTKTNLETKNKKT